jgi:hypothetical protein
MNCPNCNLEISINFKHALQKNECPACGSSLMDVNVLAMLGDIKDTILAEANIREETAQKLAMTIVTKYRFAGDGQIKKAENVKVYPASSSNPNIAFSAKDIMKEDISDAEREKILEEALQNKYSDLSLSSGVSVMETDPDLIGPNIDVDEGMISRLTGGGNVQGSSKTGDSLFADGGVNPYAEQKRQEAILRQRQNISSGSAKVKRG